MATFVASTNPTNAGIRLLVDPTDYSKKYIVCVTSSWLYIYNNLDTTPSLLTSQSDTVVGFGANVLYWFDAQISSSGIIHVVVWDNDTSHQGGPRYNTYVPGLGWNTWETVLADVGENPLAFTYKTVALDLDSNDIPGVAFCQFLKDKGTTYAQNSFSHRTGGSWLGTPELIGTSASTSYRYTAIAIQGTMAAGNVRALYNNSSTSYRRIRAAGSWGTQSTLSNYSAILPGYLINHQAFNEISSTQRDYGIDGSGNLYQNDTTDTGINLNYSGQMWVQAVSHTSDGKDLVLGRLLSSNNTYLWINDSGWDSGTLVNEQSASDLSMPTSANIIMIGTGYVPVAYYQPNGTNGIYYDTVSLATGTTYYQSAAGTITPAGTLKGKAKKALAGTLTTAGNITKKAISKISGLLGSLTPSGNVFKKATRSLAGVFNSSGTLTAKIVVQMALAGTISFVGDITKKTIKATGLSGTLTTAGELFKRVPQHVAGVISFVGDLYKRTPFHLSGTLNMAGDVWKKTTRSLSGVFSSSGEVTTRIVIQWLLEGTISFSGTLQGKAKKVLSGALGTAGTLTKKATRSLSGAWSGAGALFKKTTRSLAGTISTAGTVATRIVIQRLLEGSISFAGAVQSKAKKALSGTLTMSGALVRFPKKVLTGTLNLAGTIRKKISISLSGALSFIGQALAFAGGQLTAIINLIVKSRVTSLEIEARSFSLSPSARSFTLYPPDEPRLSPVIEE